jgi:hypothetical protein
VIVVEVVVFVAFSFGSCVEVTHITRHKKTPKRRVAFTIILSIFGQFVKMFL